MSLPSALNRLNLTTALLDHNLEADRGDRVALRCVDRRGDRLWTYREVLEQTCRFANALRELGVRPGDRVILILPDSVEWVTAFLGALRLGAIPVPLNTWMPARDYEYYFADSGARALVAAGDLVCRAAAEWTSFAELALVVVAGDADLEPIAGHSTPKTVPFGELDGDTALDPPPTRRDDAAFWLYSSGTTGRPKGVVHRHGSAIFSAEQYGRRILELTAADTVFSAAKLFFAYGLGNSLYFPMHVGATSVLLSERSTPAAVFEVLRRHRPTVFFSVPTLYASMLERAAEIDSDLSSLRLCVSAGEPLPAEIFRRWRQLYDVPILDGIGTTELVHIFISNRPGEICPGSTGRPVPGYEARVADEEGADVAVGEVGNLLVKGPTGLREYWGRPDATASVHDGEWVRTGDKYRIDERGFYWYAGRSDDMLRVSGLWVSPFEVESAVLEHDAVLECAVVGWKNEAGLVKPKAFIVLKEGREASPSLAASIQTFVKTRLAPYKYPRAIEFVASLPKTATGKVQRYRLRQRASHPA